MTCRDRTPGIRAALALPVLLATAVPAHADSHGIDSTAKLPSNDRGAMLLGLQLGVLLPQPFSVLTASPFAQLEVGYLLPFARRLLGITGTVGLAAPYISGRVDDPRFPGGGYAYNQSTQQFLFGVNVIAKIPLGRIVPYVGFGPRLVLVRTPSSGAATDGTAIDPSSELSREWGLAAPVGLDILLGPGRLFLEAQVLFSPSPQVSTGEASFGAVTAGAGYRVVLGCAPPK